MFVVLPAHYPKTTKYKFSHPESRINVAYLENLYPRSQAEPRGGPAGWTITEIWSKLLQRAGSPAASSKPHDKGGDQTL